MGAGFKVGGKGLAAVADYDVITIGGKQYSVAQLLNKTIVAEKDVTLYPSLLNDIGKRLVKKGQVIGKLFSYLNPTSKNNPTGKVVLQFQVSVGGVVQNFWLKDDKAVSTTALSTQGTKTVAQEITAEKDEEEKKSDPIFYYAKKIGIPVLKWGAGLFIGGIVLKELFQLGKESLRKKAGLSGVKRRKSKSKSKGRSKRKSKTKK